MSNAAPERIEPFYEIPDDLKDSVLLPAEDAELTQLGQTFSGKLRIMQQWLPLASFVEFTTDSTVGIEMGEAKLKSLSFEQNIKVVTIKSSSIQGFWGGCVEIGSDHKLDRVTFHLPNYSDLYGGHDYQDEIFNEETTINTRWSQVVLENDGWRVVLQPHRDVADLRQKALSQRINVMSGIGEIRRSDGQQFKKGEVKPLIEILRVFLSFAKAEWLPPLFIVGSNNVASKSWQMLSNHDVIPQWYSRGWLDDLHGYELANAFPGFCKLWTNEEWREPLTQAVTWLIEASRQSGGTNGAIAFGQIPLEMLSWLVFVEDRPVIDQGEFERLSAASKLQLLLAHCGIPLDVPLELKALSSIATGDKRMSGPGIATEVRNAIIHPQKKNREKLDGWATTFKVSRSDMLWETKQLFKWYITLVLLRLMGYTGRYANRLTSHQPGAVEQVPWTSIT